MVSMLNLTANQKVHGEKSITVIKIQRHLSGEEKSIHRSPEQEQMQWLSFYTIVIRESIAVYQQACKLMSVTSGGHFIFFSKGGA